MMKVPKSNPIQAFKVFKPDFTCRGYQFQVGKTFIHRGPVSLCDSGFHFCPQANDCFEYYKFDPQNIVCEIEAWGTVDGEITDNNDKQCASHIKIVRAIPWQEVLLLVNVGSDNTGRANSGNWNSGNWNSGDWNSGDWNSGNRNSGDWNSGYGNSGDGNSGGFNSDPAPVLFFNKPTNLTHKQAAELNPFAKIAKKLELTWWVSYEDLPDAEKDAAAKLRGGRLYSRTYQQAFILLWENLTYNQRRHFTTLPNFDAKIFEQITGVRIES